MKSYIAPIAPAKAHSFFKAFDRAVLASDTDRDIVLGGFAYATLGGTAQLVTHLGKVAKWKQLPKQFLIGIHHGITEPSALDLLRGVPLAQVRIFVPGGKLSTKSLIETPLFHPKVLAIGQKKSSSVSFLQAGSANLTSSAVSSYPRNFEVSISVENDGVSPRISGSRFRTWWSSAWGASLVASDAVIKKYAAARLAILDSNPILRQTAVVPANVASAEYFFIEVGAGSGPPGARHQVEFSESLAAYFGPPAKSRRDISLSLNGTIWHSRPLSHKQTTYGVDIWRLGMPTQTTGGVPISHQAIRFRRTLTPNVFEFEVANPQGARFAKWNKDANALGHLGSTHGQGARLYGFY